MSAKGSTPRNMARRDTPDRRRGASEADGTAHALCPRMTPTATPKQAETQTTQADEEQVNPGDPGPEMPEPRVPQDPRDPSRMPPGMNAPPAI